MGNFVVANKNIINTYQPAPSLFYDVEGVLVENKGKDIKIEKTLMDKTVEYTLRLKEEIEGKIGETVKVDKENIVASRMEEKEEKVEDEEEVRKVADILRSLGLEYTEENIRMIEDLIKSGITITRDKLDSYIKSKEYLNKIIEDIDPNLLVKLMDRGIDFQDENLQNLSEAIEGLKNERVAFSIKRFLKLEKDLTYKEAEEISREIYGQKMGKDVYDTIIALGKEKLPMTKENIDRTLEAMGKLYDLRGLENKSYVEILQGEEIFSIDNLFRIKNSYTSESLERSLNTESFESFTIEKEVSIDSLKEMLLNLNIEETMDNISILREFIVNDMAMDKENYNKIMAMKEAVSELSELLDHRKVASLIHNEIDPTKEDIHELLESLKMEDIVEKPIDEKKTKEIMKDLEALGQIQDKDLLQLLKQGKDFNLKSIKEIVNTDVEKELTIEYKTLNKTKHITNIFNTLGEELSGEVISLASKRNNSITLENLYISHRQVKQVQEPIKAVDPVQEGLIFDEYIRAKNNLTSNMIRESIKDGKVIENMPLDQVNSYIEKKVNRYREIDRMARQIENIKGHEEKILAMIMKNNLPMTLKEIKDINEFLNGEKGISQTLKSIMDRENERYGREFKEEVRVLQEKISRSIKDGDEGVKENYKDLMSLMENPNNSFSENRDQDKEGEEYMEIQGKISKKDMLLQFPIDSGNGYRDLNIIIPDIEKGIDRNNMSFSVILEIENLGMVTMDLQVRGREVQIQLKEDGGFLRGNIEILKESLGKLGYRINMKGESIPI